MLFFLLCLYIACYYIRPFEWIPGLIGSPLFVVLSAFSILVLISSWAGKKINLFRYKTDQLMLGFIVAIALSHLSHGYFGGAVDSLQKFLPILVGYFLVAHGLDSRKKINLFIILLIALTGFLAYEGIIEGTTGFSHGGMTPIYEYSTNTDGVRTELPRVRWFGPFNDPNDLGLVLVLIIPFLLNYLYTKLWVVVAPLIACVSYAVYLTNSRGAMLSMGVGVFSYLVLRYRSVKGVMVGCILGAVGMLFGPSRMGQMSAAGESAHGRIEAWYEGFQMFKSNPLFGVGKEMFTDHHYLTAHNSYVLVLSELGFFGSFFFIGLFIISFRWAWLNLLSTNPSLVVGKNDRNLFCALFGSLSGVMAAMFFLSRSYILLPFMLIAMLTAFVNLPQFEMDSAKCSDLAPTMMFKLVSIVVVCEIVFINVLVRLLL